LLSIINNIYIYIIWTKHDVCPHQKICRHEYPLASHSLPHPLMSHLLSLSDDDERYWSFKSYGCLNPNMFCFFYIYILYISIVISSMDLSIVCRYCYFFSVTVTKKPGHWTVIHGACTQMVFFLYFIFRVTLFQSLFLKGIKLTSPAMATAMPNLAPGIIFIIAWTLRYPFQIPFVTFQFRNFLSSQT
jgi:hypothetical protein